MSGLGPWPDAYETPYDDLDETRTAALIRAREEADELGLFDEQLPDDGEYDHPYDDEDEAAVDG